MTSEFYRDVQSIVEPILTRFGLVLDTIYEGVDKDRGGSLDIVYYRSSECRIQIYQSSREGETNCMITPLDAVDGFGLRTEKWQYLPIIAVRDDVPLEELVRLARDEYESYSHPLEWVRDRIVDNYQAAHDGIRKMHGSSKGILDSD